MSDELYKAYRPKSFKDVLGQGPCVKALNDMVKKQRVPHAILFNGPSGCGKTTCARILTKRLNCGKQDFKEVNCADFNGIEMVRGIRQQMNLAPIQGDCRVWLIDEAHQLSSAAQDAFLKMLEDTPKTVYFFLATTDPHKLKPTIRTRCHNVTVKELSIQALTQLVESVCDKEDMAVGEAVVEKLVECAQGSARKALVLLHAIVGMEEEEAINTIESADLEKQAIQLARLLLNPRCTWKEAAALLKELKEEPEQLRRMVLGYATSVLLNGGNLVPRCYKLIDAFRDNYYDCGRAGLAASCYLVTTGK